MAEPATKGYEISRFETNQFMRALGLDPNDVESIRIVKARAVATLTTGSTIHIRITETRGGKP
jgi:coenzyme F420-reducing hydrogenase beta subunit